MGSTAAPRLSPFLLPEQPTEADLLAKYFKVLAEPTRVRVLELLADGGERSVSQLMQALGQSQSKVSNHLACLRWCGFVTTRREHRVVHYRVADERVLQVVALGRALLADNAEHVAACRHMREAAADASLEALVKLEVLYFDGCPSHEALMLRLRELMARAGVDAPIELKHVESVEAAERERFLGSPTLRVNGQDVDPTAGERTDFGLKCRLYPGADGLRSSLPDEFVVAALTRARREHADPFRAAPATAASRPAD